MTDFHVTQDVVEALTQPAPDLRVTQYAIEVLNTAPTTAQVTQSVIEVLGSLVAAPNPDVGAHWKAKMGNKHIRTDENGAVKVVAVTAGSLTGPLTPFANVQVATDDTGAIKFAPITLNPPLGPLTDLANLRVCTDENEALLVATQTAGATVGPLTNLGNLRARTDARGSLVVASVAAGSLQTPLTPTLNLRGRTDENGALVVTGLSNPLAYQQRILADGASSYWPLDDPTGTTARDLAGANPATISGDVTLAQPGVTSSANALQFNSLVTGMAQSPVLTLPSTATIELWALATGAAGNKAIVVAAGRFQWYWTGGGATNRFAPTGQTIDWVSVLPLGAWLHLVLTATSLTTAELYVNGALVSSQAVTVALGGSAAINIGSFGNSQSWFGKIQDVALYPRALSAAEVLAHYNLRLAT